MTKQETRLLQKARIRKKNRELMKQKPSVDEFLKTLTVSKEK